MIKVYHTALGVYGSILTPKQAIQKLIHTIDSMHLSKSTTTSLEAPLNAAIRQLNHNNEVSICNLLNAFLHQVDTKETNGQLKSNQATDLRQQAIDIQEALECASSSISPSPSSFSSLQSQQQSPHTNLTMNSIPSPCLYRLDIDSKSFTYLSYDYLDEKI